MTLPDVSRSLADLDPRLRPKCKDFINQCTAQGLNVFITQTFRSNAEQNRDYARGRTVPGSIITNAKGGESPHNCTDLLGNPAARAFDFATKAPDGTLDWDASDSRWLQAIEIGISIGLISGSTFHSMKDSPHLEMPNWRYVEPWNPASEPGSTDV